MRGLQQGGESKHGPPIEKGSEVEGQHQIKEAKIVAPHTPHGRGYIKGYVKHF